MNSKLDRILSLDTEQMFSVQIDISGELYVSLDMKEVPMITLPGNLTEAVSYYLERLFEAISSLTSL